MPYTVKPQGKQFGIYSPSGKLVEGGFFTRDAAEDQRDEWEREAAEAAAQREDSPCIEDGVHNCDDAGTGEGRYHGRI